MMCCMAVRNPWESRLSPAYINTRLGRTILGPRGPSVGGGGGGPLALAKGAAAGGGGGHSSAAK